MQLRPWFVRLPKILTRAVTTGVLPRRARHPGYASALNNLALIQKNRGEMDAAAVLYEEALDVYKLVYGDVHPSCAMAMHNTCLL
jgi:hypothetical protein